MKLYDTEIVQFAQDYEIDSKWMKAIIGHESSWNPYAVRYEPTYPYLYELEKSAKSLAISLDTEIATQKMSWGLCQIMGGLARELGFTETLPKLLEPIVNLKYFSIRLAHLKSLNNDKDYIFAAYNAGPGVKKNLSGIYSNQKYVDAVNQIWTTLV